LPPQIETDASFTILETALDKQQCSECGERAGTDKQEATGSTPVRRIKLISKSTNARKSKRTVIVQSTKVHTYGWVAMHSLVVIGGCVRGLEALLARRILLS
jgi:hypothetical protein